MFYCVKISFLLLCCVKKDPKILFLNIQFSGFHLPFVLIALLVHFGVFKGVRSLYDCFEIFVA